jgi:hypothetical protein
MAFLSLNTFRRTAPAVSPAVNENEHIGPSRQFVIAARDFDHLLLSRTQPYAFGRGRQVYGDRLGHFTGGIMVLGDLYEQLCALLASHDAVVVTARRKRIRSHGTSRHLMDLTVATEVTVATPAQRAAVLSN